MRPTRLILIPPVLLVVACSHEVAHYAAGMKAATTVTA